MSLTFHWFLPTYGDSRHIVGGGHGLPAGAAGGQRPATLGYLTQIARAAEQLGFEGTLTPTGAWCEDAWLTTAMLARETERLKFLIALRPGAIAPTLAAQMAATFQRHAPGRLLLNIVTGGESHEQRAYGDFLGKEARYARTGEFLSIVRDLWQGRTVDFSGEHLRVEQARLARVPDPVPPVYFGGSSAAAGEVAARFSDVYLTWGEPPAQVAEKITWIRKLAADAGRTVRFGIRLHVITRDTADQAWAEARRLLDGFAPEAIRAVQEGLARSESEGQRRMLALHGGSTDGLEVAPNLWAGIGLVRGGAGTALVGSHAEVAERIVQYQQLGIEEFVLSGHPHVEEAYWFGEGVLPRLEKAKLWRRPGETEPVTDVQIPFAGRG
ncbi:MULTISPECIES: LLM class flavin-dependent oxidoreductase [Streptomyces]|uniref:LLM class flavin-dependent oxidoreductase n=3 Tax=Streptomyces rimosus TaxID=1927 RepID=L8EGL2_STRR1|nr:MULTISPECIES: LLM class flavin-dependent oxidoreductase [Streptomyces]KOG79685.1 alkanesulfonate monooxygenase [Kitasatospora aureofaciens]MYT42505.1 LLM class flavin-dependent oxidoreductase [Streptomyces sp. SID5471]KUJ40921.1 alkanesulfonate monooxygenase [Streptomyces rimosus subsp. rimosus]QDA10389.1 LLM class flavin-dependent oxidoreductase [Streptomyces rimosus]QGY70995.1 LLM class flavin-dependent oxidoreductase [Streptomyces rimosus R6-500]